MKKLIWLGAFFLFLSAPSFTRRAELKKVKGVHFAHRGLHDAEDPENTLGAFQKAIDQGYGIELDVHLTVDRIPVIHHDFEVVEHSGTKKALRSLDIDRLRQYTLFGTKHTIPTLQEALECIAGQVPVVVEIKSVDLDMTICRKTAELLDAYRGELYLESFNPFVLFWFRRHRPQYLRGQLSYNSFRRNKISLINFLATHYLTNFLSRPHFVSHENIDLKDWGFQVQRKFYRTFGMSYTIRSQAEWDEVKALVDVQFFEGYLPKREK